MPTHLSRLSTVAFVLTSIGCRPAPDTCTATVTYEGKTYTASGRNEPFAEGAACEKHCLDDDLEVRASYDGWKVTPEGKRSTKSREAAIRTDAPMHLVMQRCSLRCVSAVSKRAVASSVTCKGKR